MIYNNDLLNTTIDDLFIKRKALIARECLELKAQFGGYLKHIEMVFKGLFSVEYSQMNNSDEKLFCETFPFIAKIAKKELGKDFLFVLVETFDALRNLFMHGISNKNVNLTAIDAIVSKIPNYSNEVCYFKNGDLTFAGLVAFLYCFSNDKMILYFIKDSKFFSRLVMCIKPIDYDGSDREVYAEKIMNAIGMSDEICIRKPSKKADIFESIFGKLMDYVVISKNNFELQMSSDDRAIMIAKGSIKNEEIVIEKGSYCLDYFDKDFKLKIKDISHFINISSNLPPMYFLVYLFKRGITKFDKNTLSEKELDMVSKYNHPKYFVDKNINTILLPTSKADIRALSQIITSQLMYLFMNFEECVYKYYKVKDSRAYSKLSLALKKVGIEGKLRDKLIVLRNFCAHAYILEDYLKINNDIYRVDLDFIFNTMIEFIDHLFMADEHMYKVVKGDFVIRVCSQIIYFKYADVIKMSKGALMIPYNESNHSLLDTKELRVNSSTVTSAVENKICDLLGTFSFKFEDNFVKFFTKSVVDLGERKISFYTVGKPSFDITFKGKDIVKVSSGKVGFLNVVNYKIN